MPVWVTIKPHTVPVYPGWKESLYLIFVRKCDNSYIIHGHAGNLTYCIIGYLILYVAVILAVSWAAYFDIVKWGERATFVRTLKSSR